MGYELNHRELQTIPKCKYLMGVGGIGMLPFSPLAVLLIGGRNYRPDGDLASRKIRRIMSALITMYTKTTGSVGAQTEQLSQIGWARGFSASTLTLISLCAPQLPTLRLQPWVTNWQYLNLSSHKAFSLIKI